MIHVSRTPTDAAFSGIWIRTCVASRPRQSARSIIAGLTYLLEIPDLSLFYSACKHTAALCPQIRHSSRHVDETESEPFIIFISISQLGKLALAGVLGCYIYSSNPASNCGIIRPSVIVKLSSWEGMLFTAPSGSYHRDGGVIQS